MTRRDRIRRKIYSRVIVVQRDVLDTPCHEWTGPTSGSGRGGDYPRMCLDGQTVAVHIVNWTNEHGYKPSKKQLDHLCRNRICVRDDHLELVTHRKNQRRRADAHREAGDDAPEEGLGVVQQE